MSAGNSFLFSFIDRYSSLIIMILSSMVISRLLSPEEIGIYSVSVGLIAIMTVFRDFGAGNYLVTASEVDEKTISAVWTVMLLFGAFFTVAVFIVGYFSGYFYETEEVKSVIYVSALTFILTPFSAVKYALLMRDMQYKVLSGVRFLGNLSSAVLSISLAYYGAGAVSLAYGSLGSIIIVTIIFMFVGRHVNYFCFSFFDLKKIVKFGGVYTFANTYRTFATILPEIIIGKYYSFHHAGVFSRGMGLSQMFHRLIIDATSPVILSSFSNSERDGRNLGDLLVYYNSLISIFGWSLLAFIGYNAAVLIRILYGEQWGEAVVYCQLACLWVSLSMVSMNIESMFLARQQMKIYLAVVFFSSTSRIIAIFVGAYYGPKEIIIAMCSLAIVSAPIILYKGAKMVGFNIFRLVANYLSAVLIALLVIAANYAVDYFTFTNDFLLLTVHSVSTAVVFFTASLLVSSVFRGEAIILLNNFRAR